MLLYIAKNFPKVRIWESATGMARSMDGQRIVRYGLKGQADLTGITDEGRFLAVEIKTGSARQSKTQKAFQNMIEKNNGIYLLVTNKKPISAQIKKLSEES